MTAGMRFVVAGSAHLDILATVSGDPDVVDKIGKVAIEIGGTACNIATALQQLGVDVVFVTAANSSPYSMFVTDHLSQRGIDVRVERNDDLALAAFSAHIDQSGEMIGAVSSMPVDQHRFDQEFVNDALDGADCVIIECNLAPQSIDQIARTAAERMIPVYLAGVSEEKCVRAADSAGLAEAFFMNRREAEYLGRHVAPNSEGNFQAIADALETTLVLTDGENGAYVVRHGRHQPPTRIQPPALHGARNFLGMGDTFLAGTLYAHVGFGLNLDLAATVMLPLVARVAVHDNSNVGPDGAVDSMLAELFKRAYTCPTTGILNRAATEKELEKMILGAEATDGQLSVSIIDVDYFKKINDTLGHNKGDEVLERVAEAIRATLRGHDKVGRWGGDEFLAITLIGEEGALQVANRMRKAVADACSAITNVTLSIGVAQWNSSMAAPKDLIAAADDALYRVKENGRDGAAAYRAHENT